MQVLDEEEIIANNEFEKFEKRLEQKAQEQKEKNGKPE